MYENTYDRVNHEHRYDTPLYSQLKITYFAVEFCITEFNRVLDTRTELTLLEINHTGPEWGRRHQSNQLTSLTRFCRSQCKDHYPSTSRLYRGGAPMRSLDRAQVSVPPESKSSHIFLRDPKNLRIRVFNVFKWRCIRWLVSLSTWVGFKFPTLLCQVETHPSPTFAQHQ